MRRFLFILSAFVASFAGHLRAQPANVQADPSTGALFRPAAATFISGNSLLTTTNAASSYQPLDADLTAIAALSTTAFGRSFLPLADAAAGRALLGLGSLATQSGTFSGTSSGTNTGDQTITLTGEVTGTGTGSFAATLTNSAVIGKVLTGYTSGAGTVAATDTILQAVQKLNGNAANLQPLDAELTAISGIAANGLIARTSASTAAARTLTGTAAEITVTNGDGVSGNPTVSLPAALTFTGKTVTGGTFASPTLTTPTIGDGSAAAPSLSFTSDTNTGIYRPAADTVGIVGGGNDVLRLTGIASATDYLEIKNGIGVATPLHILASGASANIGVHLQPKGTGLFTISDGTDFNKGIRFRSSSSAASAVTLIDAVSTAGRVITLPDITGTLATLAGTEALSNKTITASAFNGTVGATTPSTVAATTLSASGAFLQDFNGAGGNAVNVRFNASNQRGGFYVNGSSGQPFVGGNLSFSSGSTFNYDKTAAAWAFGDPSGNNALNFYWAASGTSGTAAMDLSTNTQRVGFYNATGWNLSTGLSLTGGAAIGGPALSVTGNQASQLIANLTSSIFGAGTSFGLRVAAGTNSSDYALRVLNQSGATDYLFVKGDGQVNAIGVYNATTGSAANVFVDSAGLLQRSTSSIRYKTDIKPYARGLADAAKLHLVTYRAKDKLSSNERFAGVIAEEMDALGFTEFVEYSPIFEEREVNEDGPSSPLGTKVLKQMATEAVRPESVRYANMVVWAFACINELAAKNDSLRARVAQLEAENQSLDARMAAVEALLKK